MKKIGGVTNVSKKPTTGSVNALDVKGLYFISSEKRKCLCRIIVLKCHKFTADLIAYCHCFIMIDLWCAVSCMGHIWGLARLHSGFIRLGNLCPYRKFKTLRHSLLLLGLLKYISLYACYISRFGVRV